MAEKISRWERFKRFLKRNMTPLWAKRFTYQVLSFLISVAMVAGVAMYAFYKTYDERTLTLADDFTVTAHSGAYDTPDNSLEGVQVAIDHGADVVEVDVRQRLDGTVVMGHDIITTNTDGVELSSVFELVKANPIKVNLDIKDVRVLPELYQLVQAYDLFDKVFMTGIEPYQAKTAADKCPGVDYYINYSPSRISIFSEDYQEKILDLLEETGAIGINCNHVYASRTLSILLHEHGYKLSEWTVDRTYEMKRALVNSPDNITTHHVDKLQETIDNWGT
ncbi:MAG: glycerophosphodiester phosphodiesterase [Eubacterium sp.]|nr:glycerophosphodiester phosphodiesterase [Eubacterium sp.]